MRRDARAAFDNSLWTALRAAIRKATADFPDCRGKVLGEVKEVCRKFGSAALAALFDDEKRKAPN